jgi:hypothetical protein
MNKHRGFMSHRPSVFTHAADSLDVDDWLKTVGKMLTTAQCDDREKVLFAARRLQGSAGAWWDAYTTAQATPNSITWQEFTESFRNHHIPAGLMRLKKKEFLSLQHGGMSVIEYRDRFIELSRYAPEEVADDPKKQERFMEGLTGPLQYQLTSHTFPSFQHLLDKAITLEAMHIELGNLKRKATTSVQFGAALVPVSFHRREQHPMLEVQVVTLGRISFSGTFNLSSTPFKSCSIPLHRLHAPMTSRLVRTPQQEPQRDRVRQVLLLVIHALSVERLVTVLTTVHRGASRIPQCRVSI